MIKLIVFDWDDVFTLGATKGYYACYHQALVQCGVYLSSFEEQKRIKAKWGKTVREELAELLKEHSNLLNQAEKNYEKILMGNTFIDHLTIIEGSKKLIADLSKKYLLAIASGINPKLLKEKIFKKFSIPNVFCEILTIYDLDNPRFAKPHPFMLQEIMKRQNVLPSEIVFIGDSKGDVDMAQAAGVTPVVVLTGHLNKLEAKKLGVKYIIEKVTDLKTILKKIKLYSQFDY